MQIYVLCYCKQNILQVYQFFKKNSTGDFVRVTYSIFG
jgi:hypothetical protein